MIDAELDVGLDSFCVFSAEGEALSPLDLDPKLRRFILIDIIIRCHQFLKKISLFSGGRWID